MSSPPRYSASSAFSVPPVPPPPPPMTSPSSSSSSSTSSASGTDWNDPSMGDIFRVATEYITPFVRNYISRSMEQARTQNPRTSCGSNTSGSCGSDYQPSGHVNMSRCNGDSILESILQSPFVFAMSGSSPSASSSSSQETSSGSSPSYSSDDYYVIPCDMCTNDNSYVIYMELPGCTKSDMTLEVVNNTLIVSGTTPSPVFTGRRTLAERYYGPFTRTFRLESDAVSVGIAATFVDGVLQIIVPRVVPTVTKITVN